MNRIKKMFLSILCIASIAILVPFQTAADPTSFNNLYQYKLDNGLQLYVAENHSVPLVFIEIAVHAGAIAQTPETAGLFHLYEHIMFKGNKKYPNAAAFQKALSDMGVANWNGGTGIELVQYYVTVPKNQLYNGLEFWSYAIRDPLMRQDEFEAEKKVVLAEITGNESSPNRILSDGMNKALFPDAPWRLDPAGDPAVVRNATVGQLRAIQGKYYIPNNAALLVGGDVNPDDVYKKVKQIYGSWEKGADPWETPAEPQNPDPFPDDPQYLVMPYSGLQSQIAEIIIQFRGPDSRTALDDTYPADMLMNYINVPTGTYKGSIKADPELMLVDRTYASGSYLTRREASVITFSAVVLSPEQELPFRAKEFLSRIQDKIMPGMYEDNRILAKSQLQSLVQGIRDDWIVSADTSSSLLGNLLSWWKCTNDGYFFNYEQKMAAVKKSDVLSVIEKYISGKNPLVTIIVNPDVYEDQKDAFLKAGFTEITKDNAYWWKKRTSKK